MRAHKNEQSVLSCEENSSCRTSEHHDDKMMLADGDHCRPAKKILTAVPVSLLTQPHSIQGGTANARTIKLSSSEEACETYIRWDTGHFLDDRIVQSCSHIFYKSESWSYAVCVSPDLKASSIYFTRDPGPAACWITA